MENKMAKTRITLGGGAIDSPLNFSVGQKISVREGNFNQKSSKLFKNLAVILNLFQHLTNKHRLTQDLCLLTSFDVGQMLKRVQHDVDYSGVKAFNAYGKCQSGRCVVLTHRKG